MTEQIATHSASLSKGSILLVEDNPDDAELTIRSLRRARLLNPVMTLANGDEALLLLQRQQYNLVGAGEPINLILLDLTLPGMDGRKLLDVIHADRHLRDVPVVVLTGSERVTDRLCSYKRGALAFLRKPIDASELLRVLGDLSSGGIYLIREAA
jgi:CheY-like chemotaxis protein